VFKPLGRLSQSIYTRAPTRDSKETRKKLERDSKKMYNVVEGGVNRNKGTKEKRVGLSEASRSKENPAVVSVARHARHMSSRRQTPAGWRKGRRRKHRHV